MSGGGFKTSTTAAEAREAARVRALAGNAAVWVTTSFVGHHAWPAAPAHRGYLSAEHRHRFGVNVCIGVLHDDREVEFHDLLATVNEAIESLGRVIQPEDVRVLGSMSCEMISRRIAAFVMERWPRRDVAVEVDEDGECGSAVVFPADVADVSGSE